jgi:geranylgeranyl diphosphate synthase type II
MSAHALVNKTTALIDSQSSIDGLLNQLESLIFKYIFSNSDSTSNNNAALKAAVYHLSSPGNKVRAKLCLNACLSLNVKPSDMLIISAVSELLHNASLIHDDIQDMDEVRRGMETVWKKFGTNVAICAGDLLLSTAYGVLAEVSDSRLLPKLIRIINERTLSVIRGQCDDLDYQHQNINSIEKYSQIVKEKSGALLGLPIELALIYGGYDDYLNLAKNAAGKFAIGYQIADDLNDIEKDSSLKGISKSLNIIFVLSDAGSMNPIYEAVELAKQSLSDAVRLADKLPNNLGAPLAKLAHQLQGQIQYERES